MYCQKCGTELGDDARFCRKCGTVVGTGALAAPLAPVERPDYEHGIKKFMLGLVFLIIAIVPIFSTGRFWWWMLFPAAPLLATGMADFLRRRDAASAQRPAAALAASPAAQSPLPPASLHQELPRARNTAELVQPPPSVTEGTTRLLETDKAGRE